MESQTNGVKKGRNQVLVSTLPRWILLTNEHFFVVKHYFSATHVTVSKHFKRLIPLEGKVKVKFFKKILQKEKNGF